MKPEDLIVIREVHLTVAFPGSNPGSPVPSPEGL